VDPSQFGTAEKIMTLLVSRANEAIDWNWQAVFARETSLPDPVTPTWLLLATAAGEVVRNTFQPLAPGASSVLPSAAVVLPLEHAGRMVGLWLVGLRNVEERVGAAECDMLTEFARQATIPLEAAIFREWTGLPVADTTGATASAQSLTRRQQEVAALVARGYTNRQIALALGVRPGTIAKHVEHILSKLSFASRARIATWVSRHGGGDWEGRA
jgi:DNA-binding CsgD family transcriptional regulator